MIEQDTFLIQQIGDRDMRFQFDDMYHSPSVTAQRMRSVKVFTSLAVKQSLFKRKMEVSVSVFDLFDTTRFKVETTLKIFFKLCKKYGLTLCDIYGI